MHAPKTHERSASALRGHLPCLFAAAMLAGCGGGDPNNAANAAAQAASAAPTAAGDVAPRSGAAVEPKTAVPSIARPGGAVRAGAATTQDAIDRALALPAAGAATPQR